MHDAASLHRAMKPASDIGEAYRGVNSSFRLMKYGHARRPDPHFLMDLPASSVYHATKDCIQWQAGKRSPTSLPRASRQRAAVTPLGAIATMRASSVIGMGA